MDIKQLQLFISLAHTLNFTKTASEFYITQPTLSHQISVLEDELGCRLFIRAPHKVYLTASGEEFFRHAIKIVDEAKKASTNVYNVEHGQTGYLRILTIHPCTHIAIKTASKFKELYPNVHIDLEIATGADQEKAISESSADIFLSFTSLISSYSQLDSKAVSREQWKIVYNKDLFEITDPTDLSSLNHIPMVCEHRETAPFLTDCALELCQKVKLEPEHIQWCASPVSMIMDIKANLGYAVLPVPDGESVFLTDLEQFPLGEYEECSVGWNKIPTNPAVQNYLDILNSLYSN